MAKWFVYNQQIIYNYLTKGRWIVVDTYWEAKRPGIYPPFFTDPEGDSCFSIYQIRWIKKWRFINGHNFFFWNFRESMRHFSLRSQWISKDIPSYESQSKHAKIAIHCFGKYLTVILRGRSGYELIHITNEAVGRVGYYQLTSSKSEKNNCFSKFSSNSLAFFGWNLLKSWHFLYRRSREKKNFPISKISAQEIRHQFFLIWSNLTIMAHMMGLGIQSESWKIIILS